LSFEVGDSEWITEETEFKLKKTSKYAPQKFQTKSTPNKKNLPQKRNTERKPGKSRGIHKSEQNAADFFCSVGSGFFSIYPEICKQNTQSK